MESGKRRLLVVEDEPLMASLLAQAVRAADFEVETASDVKEAKKKIESFDPDIALLDISLGDGPSGVQFAHVLRATRPDIAILFLTKHADAKSANAEGLDLPTGVGFLRKMLVNDSSYLLSAIEKVLSDQPSEVRQDQLKGGKPGNMTERSYKILELIAQGFSNAEIASQAEASIKSVERWVDHLYHELGIQPDGKINARVEATRKYFEMSGFPERKI
jgi:DNA-binding NarL/FixJ family response regulator